MSQEYLPIRDILIEELAKSIFMIKKWGLRADGPEQLEARERYYEQYCKNDEDEHGDYDGIPYTINGRNYYRKLARQSLEGIFRLIVEV